MAAKKKTAVKSAKRVRRMWGLFHPRIGAEGSLWPELFPTRRAARDAVRRKRRSHAWHAKHGKFPAAGKPVQVDVVFSA